MSEYSYKQPKDYKFLANYIKIRPPTLPHIRTDLTKIS